MARFLLLASALVLSATPQSEWLARLWPQWALLAVICWSLVVDARPRGIVIGAGVGLLLDALRAATLGQHAACLALAAYLAGERHATARHHTLLQRWLLVALLVAVAEGLRAGATTLLTGNAPVQASLLSALLTVAIYPLVERAATVLRRIVGRDAGALGA